MIFAVPLAEIVFFALLCHGVGRWFVRRLPSPSPFITTAVATGLGYGILGMVLFFLANAGVLALAEKPTVSLSPASATVE